MMKRIASRWWAAGAVLLGLAAIVAGMWLLGLTPARASRGTASLAPAMDEKGPIDVRIVHSNDTWGYILPCG
jgi:hypothetical protein